MRDGVRSTSQNKNIIKKPAAIPTFQQTSVGLAKQNICRVSRLDPICVMGGTLNCEA